MVVSQRLVFVVSYITAVGVLRTPTNRTACISVPSFLRVKSVSSVSFVNSKLCDLLVA
jgi:hypothetical protein